MCSLQNNQRSAVSRMINLNSELSVSAQKGGSGHVWSDKWKVLIYDKASRSTVAPLLSVQGLRQLGITVYMMVDTPRQKIPDVPAVYFLKPTLENVQIVARDCNQGLYQSVHVNFSSTLPRALLEHLAEATSKGGGSQRVARLMDQYLDFVSLEPCLFTLERPLTYYNYSKDNVNEKELTTCLNEIVNGLFSVVVTLGMVPIIRAPVGGPAEMIARQLDDKLRKAMRNSKTQHLFQQDNNGTGGGGGGGSSGGSGGNGHTHSKGNGETGQEGVLRERPVMVLLDRGIDLGQVLHHTSLYQPLVDDLLDFQLNRVSFTKDDAQKSSFTLDPNVDDFWNQYGGQLFPDAVEGNTTDRSRLAKEEQQISSSGQTGDMSNIASAVASLERHMEHKKRSNDHFHLLEATMKVIVARSLHEFQPYEENIVSGRFLQSADHEKYLTLLGNPQKGTYMDKLRFCIVWISRDVNMASERPELLQNLILVMDEIALSEHKNKNIHLHIFQHVQQVQRLSGGGYAAVEHQNGRGSGLNNGGTGSGSGNGGASWSLSGLTKTMGAVLAKAKEWIPKAAPDTKITQVMSNVMLGKTDASTASLLYFDPKIGTKSVSLAQESRRKGSHNAGITFVVGGVTYTEYHNIKEWAKKQKPIPKNIIVGSTSMLNAENFIDELSRFSPDYNTGSMD